MKFNNILKLYWKVFEVFFFVLFKGIRSSSCGHEYGAEALLHSTLVEGAQEGVAMLAPAPQGEVAIAQPAVMKELNGELSLKHNIFLKKLGELN